MAEVREVRHSPVIVIGMHRSGTSALVRALGELGLFTGYDLEPNAEARYFLNLNEEMLNMAGARWDAPDSMLRLLKDTELIDWLAQWLEPKMSGLDTSLYLGKPGWLRHRDIRNYPQKWGWKDPRNTLTLPIWLRLFPGAKVVHVVRHAVDVAASLQVREEKLRQRTMAGKLISSEWRLTSPRCLDLQYGFNLWEQYVAAGEAALSMLPEQQHLTLTFEDWLMQPEQYLHRLNDWLELNAGDEQIQKVVGSLKTDRRFAFRQNDTLVQFARNVCPKSEWIQRFYSEGNTL